MVKVFGLEIGAYGFIVDIMREILAILFMSLLIKIRLGSPITSAGAGSMDNYINACNCSISTSSISVYFVTIKERV